VEDILSRRGVSVAPPKRPHSEPEYLPFAAPKHEPYRVRQQDEEEESDDEDEDEDEEEAMKESKCFEHFY
jgi:hypothetical protein